MRRTLVFERRSRGDTVEEICTFCTLRGILQVAEQLSGTKAKWDHVDHTWHFTSGAKVAFGFLENDADVYHHQSAEYHFIVFDEVTQFTEFQYTYMISRGRRLQGTKVPIRIRSASNPPGLVNGLKYGFCPGIFVLIAG